MKKIIFVIIFTVITLPSIVFSTDNEEYLNVFDQLLEVTIKLYNLDKAMYSSLDLLKSEPEEILNKISIYRFCLPDTNKTYRVYYGYPDSNLFKVTCSYKSDANFNFIKDSSNYSAIDISLLYNIAKKKEYILAKYYSRKVDLSYYFLPDSASIKMYLIPAWQGSGLSVYGPEFNFTFDYKGNQIDSLIIDKEPLAYNSEKENEDEIYLDYRDFDNPTVGSLFFIMLFKPYFSEIVLETKTMKSYLMNISNSQWGHIRKEKN